MRKTMTVLCVLCTVALAAPAWGATNYWQAGAAGNWTDVPSYWSDGLPTSDDLCRIENGGTCTINSAGAVAADFYVGNSGGKTGNFVINAGTDLTVSNGFGVWNSGSITQNGGSVSGIYRLYFSGGQYTFAGGSLTSCIVDWSGAVDISGGSLISTDYIRLKSGAKLTADAGSVISIAGSWGAPLWSNAATDAGATGLAGLNNVTVDYGGGYDRPVGNFEVAGTDMGAVMAGLTENFALEGLNVASSTGTVAIKLVDASDNSAGAGNEALYVETLNLYAGATVETNGFNLYYLNGTIDANATVDTSGGGGIYQIPEPATMSLLVLGGIGVLIRRKRR